MDISQDGITLLSRFMNKVSTLKKFIKKGNSEVNMTQLFYRKLVVSLLGIAVVLLISVSVEELAANIVTMVDRGQDILEDVIPEISLTTAVGLFTTGFIGLFFIRRK